MTAILLFSMVFSAVSAAPPLPFERYGTADVNSTYISSWIDGVEYGNCTTSAAGAYTIDTVSDDTVPDAIRTGGINGDPIQYARTSLTGTAARFFTQTDSHVIGGAVNGALTSEGADTPLLKIAILNPQPTVALMGDYIALYNPTGAPVDVTSSGWGIAIGTGATHTIVDADIMPFLTSGRTNPIPATTLLYLNLSTAGWATSLSTTGNSIKLYYNTHIVDRVEYGAIATEPENTLMSNAAVPAAGFEAYRTPAYTTDTNKCLPDFTTRAQTVPYDPIHPTITTIVPADGATGVAINAQVVVTWSEAMDPLVGSVNINPARTGAWVWSGGNTVYTFTPGGNWAYNTLYTLTFSSFTDVAGRAATGDLVKVFTTVVQASATATGPISATPTNVVGITITYTWTDTPTSVNLYYTMNGGTTWILAGNDVTVNGNYAYTIVSGSGTYGWGASAVGGGSAEPSPITAGTAPEATPYILDITAPTLTHVPATGATGVALGANVVVTYSEAMNPAVIPTLTQTAGSPIVAFTWGGWTVGNTVATWTHATAWAALTLQTVQVSGGSDVAGNAAPTVSWSFTTGPGGGEKVAPATGLDVTKSGTNNVVITWTNPTASNFWDVYASTNKATVKQPGNLLGTVPDGTGTYTHINGQTTGTTLFYLVIGRGSAGTEAGYSTMGVKVHKVFTVNAATTNIMWLTIPQDSGYATASAIVLELEGALSGPGLDTKINAVGKWVPSGQYSTAFVYDTDFEEWTGDDFVIGPGDGIYLGITSSFNWIVCGVDVGSMQTFTVNAATTNIMWFNLPSTCTYTTASQIVLELEGALSGPGLDTKINAVGKWVPSGQYSTAFVYDTDFEEWTGDDFVIAPGDGIYIGITSSFTWNPALITPIVP